MCKTKNAFRRFFICRGAGNRSRITKYIHFLFEKTYILSTLDPCSSASFVGMIPPFDSRRKQSGLLSLPPFSRGAGNRTQTARSQTVYTTIIRRPVCANNISINLLLRLYCKRMTIDFRRVKENFICEKCARTVEGDGYTNHCPYCLWSKHVDNTPGDRQAKCNGMMKPVDVTTLKGDQILIHKCVVCGHEKRNKAHWRDDFDKLVDVVKQRNSLM